MRGMDDEEDVKNDGKPVPNKPKTAAAGKKPSRNRSAGDDPDVLNTMIRA